MAITIRIQVGATPSSKDAKWDDHREALRQEATANRTKRVAVRM